MPPTNLTRLLASIGKDAFVRHFELFRDLHTPNEEIVAKLPPEYTLKSRQSRVSKARRIIREGLSRDALEIIAASTKLAPETVSKARSLLNHI